MVEDEDGMTGIGELDPGVDEGDDGLIDGGDTGIIGVTGGEDTTGVVGVADETGGTLEITKVVEDGGGTNNVLDVLGELGVIGV